MDATNYSNRPGEQSRRSEHQQAVDHGRGALVLALVVLLALAGILTLDYLGVQLPQPADLSGVGP